MPFCTLVGVRGDLARASDLEADAAQGGQQLRLDCGKEAGVARRMALKAPQRALRAGRIQHPQAAEQPIDRRLHRGPRRESDAKLVQRATDVAFRIANREPGGELVHGPERCFDRRELLIRHRALRARYHRLESLRTACRRSAFQTSPQARQRQ